MRYPNLFLIGAPKAGTTFLHAHLAGCHDIFAPAMKEPAYFLYQGQPTAQYGTEQTPLLIEQRDEAAYLALFRNWQSERYAIDASTHYLQGPKAAEHIQAAAPDAKIIAVFRDPLDRAFSHYLMKKREGWFDIPFDQAIGKELEEMQIATTPSAFHYGFLRQSAYFEATGTYLRLFGPDNLRIYRFEDVTQNLEAVLTDLSTFLGVPVTEQMVDDMAQNKFRAERLPFLVALVNIYHRLPLKLLVNRIVPRRMRDWLRVTLLKVSYRDDEKPQLPQAAADLLNRELKDDYTRALGLAGDRGILFDADQHATRSATSLE